MKFIIKPNKAFDKLNGSVRFISVIIIFLISMGIEYITKIHNIGLLLIGIIGVYRISYFIIVEKK